MALTIEDPDRFVLLEELERFDQCLGTSQARQRHAALRLAVSEGEVSDELERHLENFLEVALTSGAVRHGHGPGREQALLEIFHRTPGGAAVQQAVKAVNEALAALAGQRIERLSFQPQLPGTYGLAIETDRCQVRLVIERGGVQARDVAVSL